MLALHAAWTPDHRLALWAERGGPPAPSRKARAKPRAHPFAADEAALRAAVEEMCPQFEFERSTLAIALPSTERAPVPSPQLWDAQGRGAPTALTEWTVAALLLGERSAADLLLARPPPQSTLVLGDSVRWLAQVARFALHLCARGRIVPTLTGSGSGWQARWRPSTVLPEDAARRAVLKAGAPPAVGAAREEVFDAALAAFVGALARLDDPPDRRRPKTAEDAWVQALAGRPLSDRPGLGALAARVERWGAADAPAPDGFRTCFRVAAPEEGQSWRIEILLQGWDDPSLLIPAAEVWRTRGQRLSTHGRTLTDPHEKLLLDLGRAIRVAPVLRSALAQAHPSAVEVDAGTAWSFLREHAAPLAQAGFALLAPAWWGRPSAGLRVRGRATPQPAAVTAAGLGLDALVDVNWEVVLGDDPITPDELERLARLKAPLVRVRGQWVELRPQDVAAALAFYARGPATSARVGDLLQASFGLRDLPGGLPSAGVTGEGWVGDLLDVSSRASFAPVAAPKGFGATLRPYQARGVGWLAFMDRLGFGACLADDMGLGKTVQVLALLARERTGRTRPPPTLLVCPMSLVGNWEREAARFAPKLRVLVHHGAERREGQALVDAVGRNDLVITTYALVARDEEHLAAIRWGRVVLDEAQNVKNASTRAARAVRALPAARRVALTGTPVENRLSELWSILDFVNPGLLGTANAFRTRFAIPIERDRDDDAAARLRQLTGPFVLRRLKTDRSVIPDLPEKVEFRVACTLTREQATLYRAVVDELMDRLVGLEAEQRRGAVLAAMTKLKQVCDHPALLLQDRSALADRSGKLARLEEILEEIVANDEKALVFTQFTEMGAPLQGHLQRRLGREVLFLHGGTPRAARDEMVRRFAEPRGPSVFLLSLKAGGTGLNLVAANHVVHFDRWWNPAVEDQATDRAFRIGQRRDVQVRKLVCAGTLEERIDDLIEGKRALAGRAVGEGEGWLADLSADALRSLVALDEREVGD